MEFRASLIELNYETIGKRASDDLLLQNYCYTTLLDSQMKAIAQTAAAATVPYQL